MDLALGHGVLVLQQQSGQRGVGLHGLVGLVHQVGGAPGHSVEALHLALLAGQILGQLVEGGGLGGVGLGLDAQQLAAVEGAHVIALAVHLEGGQVSGAQVVAQDAGHGLIGPGAGDHDGAAAVEAGAVRGAEVHGGVYQLLHALGGDEAVGAVEGILHGHEVAVRVGFPGGLAAGAEEEGSDVPGGGVGLHGEVLAGGLAVSHQLLQGIQVLLGDNGLVIVHEVAVIGGQGVGIQLAVDGGSSHHTGIVSSGNSLGSLHAQLVQSAGLHQTGKLILREAEQVAAGFHVGDHLGSGVALAHRLHGGVEGDAILIALVEGSDLLLGQVNDSVSAPYGDVVGARQLAAGVGLLSGLAAAAGHQGQSQGQGQHKCQNLFHLKSS